MAAYNPLSYFSFGKKKDEEVREVVSETPEQSDSPPTGAVEEPGEDTQPAQPLLRVLKGNPTDEELAALTAVVYARAQAAQKNKQGSLLSTASRLLNRRQWLGASLKPGPGSWRRARPQ